MRFTVVLAFIACLIAVVAAGNCPLGCKRNYKPMCGMKYVDGEWEERIFSNECEMRNENECLGGKYIPCKKVDYED